MKTNFFLPLFAALSLTLAACSEDEGTPANPAGSVSVNLLNEQFGKTFVGPTDVYINKANNLSGSEYYVGDQGKRSGLGAVPGDKFNGLAVLVAAEPGRGYVLCDRFEMRSFPSGAQAMKILTTYYKLFIRSWIRNEETITGAAVDYVACRPKTYGLPEYGSMQICYVSESVEVELSTSDSEYLVEGLSSFSESDVEVKRKGRKLLITAYSTGSFYLYLRIGGSYTRVEFTVNYRY